MAIPLAATETMSRTYALSQALRIVSTHAPFPYPQSTDNGQHMSRISSGLFPDTLTKHPRLVNLVQVQRWKYGSSDKLVEQCVDLIVIAFLGLSIVSTWSFACPEVSATSRLAASTPTASHRRVTPSGHHLLRLSEDNECCAAVQSVRNSFQRREPRNYLLVVVLVERWTSLPMANRV